MDAMFDHLRVLSVIVIVQALWLSARLRHTAYLELGAYFFHAVFVGTAAVTMAWVELQGSVTTIEAKLLVAGLHGQLVLGVLCSTERPLHPRVHVSREMINLLMLACASAALVKFGLYYREVMALGGHLAIYTDGDAIRDSSPLVVRLLASGAPFVAVLTLTQRGTHGGLRVLALIAICLEFLIGTRARPLFLLAAAVALNQRAMQLTKRRFRLLAAVAVAVLAGATALGYVREEYDLPFALYMLVVFESLAGTVHAALGSLDLASLRGLVLSQILPLLMPTDLASLDTVSKSVSFHLMPAAYERGYGLSSSLLLEVNALVSPGAVWLFYPLMALLWMRVLRACLDSPRPLIYLAGIAMAPAAFYIWRAEAWQPVVSLAKAAPFIVLALLTARRVR
jgi:hypothetical protein